MKTLNPPYNPANQEDLRADRSTHRAKAIAEVARLLLGPQRMFPLLRKLIADGLRTTFDHRHLYSFTTTKVQTSHALQAVIRWLINAQRRDGGIAAYYSLLAGYAESYPETTGYIIPTLFRYAHQTGDETARFAAQRATEWLLPLQMPCGAFPAGLHGSVARPSVFNTGQILQGLVCAHRETGSSLALESATAAGQWLITAQDRDGSWSGAGAYQGVAHTYYSMVSWALAELANETANSGYAEAADKNVDWVLRNFRANGWIDGINLRGPSYLHFIAYAIQGVLEYGVARKREVAIQTSANSAWVLLRKFETNKRLLGIYEPDFKGRGKFACLTGNAQMSCVWLRLFEITGDLRYLNAGLKMNEMLKERLPLRGHPGVVGGVAGSHPIWGRYQPLRFISWGCKFLADALQLEQSALAAIEATECGS